MNDLKNWIKGLVGDMLAQRAQPRHGLVANVNPNNGTVRVTWDEDGTLSGELPIAQQAVGAGWSAVTLPKPGTQVFCVPDMGDSGSMVVVGQVHSAQQPIGRLTPYMASSTVPLVPGEPTIMGPDGQFIRLPAGGGIQSRGTWIHDGDFKASGNVMDLNNVHGSLAVLRDAYNAHKHPDAQGGTVGPTDHPTP